jgi:hypothetical protein
MPASEVPPTEAQRSAEDQLRAFLSRVLAAKGERGLRVLRCDAASRPFHNLYTGPLTLGSQRDGVEVQSTRLRPAVAAPESRCVRDRLEGFSCSALPSFRAGQRERRLEELTSSCSRSAPLCLTLWTRIGFRDEGLRHGLGVTIA